MKYALFIALAFALNALADQNDGAFMKPVEPAASHMATEASELAKQGQPDAKLLLDTLDIGWSYAHPDLPIDPYVGCMLYQFGGIQSFVDLHYAEMVAVLAGDPAAEDGGEAAAMKFVRMMTPKQKIMAERLKFFMKKYAVTCDAHLTGHLSPDELGL